MKTWYVFLSVLALATLISNPATADVIYFNDFEDASDPLTEWSHKGSTPSGDPLQAAPGIAATPGTIQHPSDRFFGQFSGNETTSLALHNLPSWTEEVRLSFDLYIIRTWDGIGIMGPDRWKLDVSDGPILLDTTFANNDHQQSYPGTYPYDAYPNRTGAFEIETLGFSCVVWTPSVIDSVYRFDNGNEFTFPYSYSLSGGDLTINFSGFGLQNNTDNCGVYDESWGLDNVIVEIVGEPPTPAEQIQEILDFVDDSVAAGTLVGVGSGKPAENKLNAFINMLEEAQSLIEAELFAEACVQLQDAREKCDGQSPPPDFVAGSAVSELAERIQALRESMNCSEYEDQIVIDQMTLGSADHDCEDDGLLMFCSNTVHESEVTISSNRAEFLARASGVDYGHIPTGGACWADAVLGAEYYQGTSGITTITATCKINGEVIVSAASVNFSIYIVIDSEEHLVYQANEPTTFNGSDQEFTLSVPLNSGSHTVKIRFYGSASAIGGGNFAACSFNDHYGDDFFAEVEKIVIDPP